MVSGVHAPDSTKKFEEHKSMQTLDKKCCWKDGRKGAKRVFRGLGISRWKLCARRTAKT